MRQPSSPITIKLPKREHERLMRLALRYGLSRSTLSRYIITQATQELLSLPEESLDEYENAKEIKQAFRNALKAEKEGKLLHTLPKSIRQLR